MLLQTNSYIVPKEKRAEHARLLQRFRQTLARLGCEHFEAYEQVGANWSGTETTGRFVQLMRFRDRKQQQQVQAAERSDPTAQALIKEFCELINFPYQQQQGLFAVGFYQGAFTTSSPLRQPPPPGNEPDAGPPQSQPPQPESPAPLTEPSSSFPEGAGEIDLDAADDVPTDADQRGAGADGTGAADHEEDIQPLPDEIEAEQPR